MARKVLGHKPKNWLEVLWVMWWGWNILCRGGDSLYPANRRRAYQEVAGVEAWSGCPACYHDKSHINSCVKNCKAAEACKLLKNAIHTQTLKQRVRDLLRKAYKKEATKRGKEVVLVDG